MIVSNSRVNPMELRKLLWFRFVPTSLGLKVVLIVWGEVIDLTP